MRTKFDTSYQKTSHDFFSRRFSMASLGIPVVPNSLLMSWVCGGSYARTCKRTYIRNQCKSPCDLWKLYFSVFCLFLVGGKLEKPIGDGGDDDSGGRDAGDDGDARGGIIVHKLSQLVIIVGIVMGSSSFPPTKKKKSKNQKNHFRGSQGIPH